MLVRTQILIFGLIGNIIIAGILLFMNVQNQNIQEKSSNSQYTSIVESAWVQSIDNSFANMNSWGPNGEKGEQYWNPYVEISLDIKSICIHDFIPRSNKVINKFVICVI